MSYRFNPAPGWPVPPQGWVPPEGWVPDPSWPPAPAGWNFWVEVPDAPVAPAAPQQPAPTAPTRAVTTPPPAAASPAPASASPAATTPMPPVPLTGPAGGPTPSPVAPASVPYAQYNHVPTAGSASQPGLVQENRRRSPLIWLVPLVLVLLGGIAWGIVALMSGNDDKPTGVAAATVTVTPTPTEAAPTSEPPADPAPTEPSTDAPDTQEPPAGDDAAKAFCPAALSLYTAFGKATATETVAEFVAIYEPAVAAMPQAAPPAEIAEAWSYKYTNDTEMIAAIKGGDQAVAPLEAYMDFQVKRALAGDDFVTHETALTDFVSDRCY
ncbi:hypothetical protein ATL41_2005 [Flavimobilis soli]|uniref:Uncharacterized protein n=1 Tax=Flavimobilis soli TaxID=442709 RepID=A0A2A9EFF0_9MICO|nr:hypothetical protein [Flavimobilis soli]PFG37251.1 hypothetical protein ATL41_2005 [Flavimobilis soli]